MDEDQSLAIVRLRGEKPLGLSALSVDLGSFLATAREVGTDAGLLLLTVRALTVRRNAPIALKELCWVLGARRHAIRRWLDRLERSGLAVWHDDGDGLLRFEIEASAFCHQMVRSIVGTLVAVGRGRRTPGELLGIMRSGDRARAADLAPPRGLTLWTVRYPGWDSVPDEVTRRR